MVSNAHPYDPDEPEHKPEEYPEFGSVEELQDSLLRGLGESKDTLPKKEKAQKPSDEDLINDRLSSFLDETEKPPEKNETWLDNFWNNEIPDREKRNPDSVDLTSDQPEPGIPDATAQVTDDALYEEWKRASEQTPIQNQEPPTRPTGTRIFDFPIEDLEATPPNPPPATHEFAFFEELENPAPPVEEESSIFTLPEDRSSEALVEMRSLIQDEAPRTPEVFISADKPAKVKKRGLKLTRLEFFLIVFILILSLATASIVIRSVYFPASVPSGNTGNGITVSSTATEVLPIPAELTMTGGWRFSLNQSTIVDGQWLPTGPEWLVGTDVSRIVALPWNAQLEAIVLSLKPGDPITLGFSNQTQIVYEVQKAEQIAVSDTDLMSNTTPSLVIILYGQDSPSRWAVTCLP